MPRDTLTRDEIVSAAIELLDRRGLEGLRMRALGESLESAATAVYWHVGSKENLLTLAVDRLWNEITLPDLATTPWRVAATEMAVGLHAMLVRHPWLVQTFGSSFLYGPGKARHDDHNLAIYEAAGFEGTRADQATGAVFMFVMGNALGPSAIASFERRMRKRKGGQSKKWMREAMAKAREIASGYPRLRARLASTAAEYGAAPEQTFEFGLHALLDGLEAQLASAHPLGGAR